MCQKMCPWAEIFRYNAACFEKNRSASASETDRYRVSKNFSARWQTDEKGAKTSNSHASAYRGTVACELRSKSKCLRGNRFACFGIWFPSKHICVNAGIRFPAVSS